ncbi:efflux RND transporter permease subunit [Zooshikella marina]|uniref:efflux RND transporter permease subunit n=1 Tax=Zooshikella ganghwensis TaxID=202772 RepID=UPI001BAE9D14|nr:efflux RND transporter permease subunit [Zooshikella ganghwensis]MBU2706693.1 efflux RND transporter permease subunit [Zooshikella ganghwensis]
MKTDQSSFFGFIPLLASHRVAAHLLMGIAIIVGLWALRHTNTQFFPNFEVDVVTVSSVWSGAAAEDIQRSMTMPIEQALKGVNGIDKVYATSTYGVSLIRIEVQPETELSDVLDNVKQVVDNLRDWPEAAEQPEIRSLVRYEPIAKVMLRGHVSLDELRKLAYRFERQLLGLGIRKIDFRGLPEQEIAIKVAPEKLYELGITLQSLYSLISQRSVDLPAGTAARKEGAKPVRSLSQARDPAALAALPLVIDPEGRLIRLGDVADVVRQPKDDQILLSSEGMPAVEMTLLRTENDDTLQAAKTLHQWLSASANELPEGITRHVFNERWQYLQERIALLLKNGVGGLCLVIIMLFLFLNARVAWWVTLGIPVSFLSALAIFYLIGGTINLVSLFGLIMTLGIIVDDAIVVGENTLQRIQGGDTPLHAAVSGAHLMLAPVVASSLTTIAAFLPLLILEGDIGNILRDIPIIVICVIVASLLECFFILPGHLHHSLNGLSSRRYKLRETIDNHFSQFRNGFFRCLIQRAVHYRGLTITAACCLLVISIGLVITQHIKFTFFPTIDGNSLRANVQFTAGTSQQEVTQFLNTLVQQLRYTEQQLGQSFIDQVLVIHRAASFGFRGQEVEGDELGSVEVEISAADKRSFSDAEIIRQWRQHIVLPAGVEKFTLTQRRAGPPGKAIEIKLTGSSLTDLKTGSQQVQDKLRQFQGVTNVEDDLPFGKEQLIYSMTPAGYALGLTLNEVGLYLRTALEGRRIQVFHDANEELEVRLRLSDAQQDYLSALQQLPVVLPDQSTEVLSNIVNFEIRRGVDSLNRVDGELAIIVSADVDENRANTNEILSQLQQTFFPQLAATHGIRLSYEGRTAEQGKTLEDMVLGGLIALLLIYIILAWVFSSYSWPFAVMMAIPFGLTGAIFGHFIMDMNLTILSLFGLFGLTGIVVNDSIVLLSVYRQLRLQGMGVNEAIVEAACRRLRAVLLTSLTTIAGLTPILFETSLQAQFLIPMATSIVFGLTFGTVIILLVVPAFLVHVEWLSKTTKHHWRGLINGY